MVNAAAAESYALPATRRRHIVDVLIEERAPRLSSSPVWPLVRPALYGLLDYRKARAMADAIAPLSGREAIGHVSDLLSVNVEARGLENLPREGRCVVVANHPTGIADGIAVHDAFRVRRPDMVFYANSDAHRVSPRLSEVLIPVEWVEEKRTRERTRLTLQMTREAMEAERALMIFPAGRLARRIDGVLTDKPWQASALSIARKYAAPVIPVHVKGPWAALFHFFDRFSGELRDITLFHELLNKKGARYRLTVGEPLDPAGIESIEALKHHVERDLA
ncbi:MAG TPA: 1-acyl-sn-glycerol-3-phosphate acyltransferase [Caulobacteraceae bacterium]